MGFQIGVYLTAEVRTIDHVILSEAVQSTAKSKNLRIVVTTMQYFSAKILRLALLAQDDRLASQLDKL